MKLRAAALLLIAASTWTVLSAEQKTNAPSLSLEDAAPKLSKDMFAGLPIFDLAKLDQIPVVKTRVAPQYPAGMRQAEIQGEVTVDFVVTTEGKVVNAFAARSSRREFEAAAVAAVSKWKFSPGTKSGKPVNTHMQVPIAFALD